MAAPILLDLSHTSHTRARTGIQRVARSLRATWAEAAVSVTYDPHLCTWRALQAWETANLDAEAPGKKRGAAWPLSARLGGRARRMLRGAASAAPPAGSALVVPEIFSAAVGAMLPRLFAHVTGARIALFHDAIALKYPELTPPRTVARFPAYLQELLMFDGVAAVSDDSRDTLLDYWRWLGVPNPPPVRTIPLAITPPAPPAGSPGRRPPAANSTSARILCVGSIEGRKNHRALLDACEVLWAQGHDFELELIGMGRAETAQPALNRIRELRDAGRRLRHPGGVDDRTVEAAYAGCTFTVYPSLLEGFGLPVLESLAHGKPCVCSGRGALGEAARGGGCVMLDEVTAPALAAAIERLVTNPAEVARLAAAARARTFRTWDDYVTDLTNWMANLPRRSSPAG